MVQTQFSYFVFFNPYIYGGRALKHTGKTKSRKINNKLMHIYNGNLKFLHLNKANSNILTKLDLVKNLIQTEEAKVISLVESNVNLNEPDQVSPITNFKFEHKVIKANNITGAMARTTLAIHNSISYTRLYDLEHDCNSLIWVKIRVHTRDVLVMSGYRQHGLLNEFKLRNTDKIEYQINRFKLYLDSIDKARNLGLDMIIMDDTNVDTNPRVDYSLRYNIKALYDMWHDTLADCKLVIHNHEYTRYAPHQKPSIIDHVVTNCPLKISPIQTKPNIISDHCSLSFDYKTKPINLQPRFRMSRNIANLTKDNLIREVENSQPLQTIYNFDDPNYVAETIQNELNRIINKLAPKKRTQIRNKKNYIDHEFLDKKKSVDKLLTTAIKSRLREDWMKFKYFRNSLYRELKLKKKKFFEDNLNDNKKGWVFIQDFNGINKPTTPRKIIHKGKLITSPYMMAEIANTHYIQKIKKISDDLKSDKDPIYLLNKVIPRKSNHDNFKLKFISIKETIKMIRSLKATYSTGEDDINNDIIKKLDINIAYQLCHMINCVMKTSIFPNIFKTTRIIPVSKPGKPDDDIDSFRPLNNMNCLEKFLEGWIQTILVEWLEAEDVINMHHHGGKQGHSTLSAKASIDNNINSNLSKKLYNITLTTDLSAAFDTINHMTLLRKLEHYGIRGMPLKLFQSYLADRKQFVEIETFRSSPKSSLNLSCCQGTKLANIFYTLYTNETPNIQAIFRCPKAMDKFFEGYPGMDLNFSISINRNDHGPSNGCLMMSSPQIKHNRCHKNQQAENIHQPKNIDPKSGTDANFDQTYISEISFPNHMFPINMLPSTLSSKSPHIAPPTGSGTASLKTCKQLYLANSKSRPLASSILRQSDLVRPPETEHNLSSTKSLTTNQLRYQNQNKPDQTCCNQNHFNNITHDVVNFVDDSTSSIGIKDINDIIPYIQNYLEVLNIFYSCNGLKLNKTKTKFQINGTKTQQNQTKHFRININNEELTNDSQITILGWKFNISGTFDSQINETIKSMNYRAHCLNKIKPYTSFQTRIKYYNAFVISKLRYMAPAYFSAPQFLLKKLNTTLVKIAKMALGYTPPRTSYDEILEKCGWTNVYSLCKGEALKTFHKIVKNEKPQSLFQLFNIPSRKAKHISIKNYKKSKIADSLFLFKILPFYNSLKSDTKQLTPKKFSSYVKKHIR